HHYLSLRKTEENGMAQPTIESIYPKAGIEGGEVIISCKDFLFPTYNQVRVMFNGVETRPMSASSSRIVASVPSSKFMDAGRVEFYINSGEKKSYIFDFIIGKKIGETLLPVATPAYDHDSGAIYTTLSGTRGQKVAV